MPYNPVTDIYTLPAIYIAIPGTTIIAQQHNDPLVDLQTAQNYERPIIGGGTGADTAAGARLNINGVGTTTDNAVARYDGTTGAFQNSTVTIGDTGNIAFGERLVATADMILATGGANRIFLRPNGQSTNLGATTLEADGSVGINIAGATPSAPLHVGPGTDVPVTAGVSGYFSNNGTTTIVARNSSANVEAYFGVDGGTAFVGSQTNHDFEIFTNNTTRLAISAAGAATFSGAVSATSGTFTGAFTSIGIDDNATGERFQLADTIGTWGTSSGDFSLVKANTDGLLYLSGGSANSTGANLFLAGGSHATVASDWGFRSGTSDVLTWDNSATTLTLTGILNTSGALTSGGGVTSSQNFASSTTSAILAATSPGAVALRPNGTGSTTGQLLVASTGNVTVNGALSATSFTGSAAGLTSIGTPISGQSVGGVGTYAMFRTSSAALSPGDTVNGASLVYTNATGDANGGNPSGTWRCMGATDTGSNGGRTSVFLRVS